MIILVDYIMKHSNEHLYDVLKLKFYQLEIFYYKDEFQFIIEMKVVSSIEADYDICLMICHLEQEYHVHFDLLSWSFRN